MTSDPKNKGTNFSSTLKVEESIVHLFLWSEVILVRYDHLWFTKDTGYPITSPLMTKSSYFTYIKSDTKDKDTLFSSTLKVEESKVHIVL